MTFPFTVRKSFATYQCHESYVIGVPNEGAVIKMRHAREVLDEIASQYEKPFIYIGDRVNASSLELAIYPFIEASKVVDHLKGVAIVAHRSLTKILAQNEVMLAHKFPVKVFNTLEEAQAWALEELEKYDG